MTADLTHRALAALPSELATRAREHARQFPRDGLSDCAGEAARALFEARQGETLAEVWNRARGRLRRFAQGNPARSLAEQIAVAEPAPPSQSKRRHLVSEVSETQHVSLRRAQQIVASQIRRARHGDLFSGEGGK